MIKSFTIDHHLINFNFIITHLKHTIFILQANTRNNIDFMKQFNHLLFQYREFLISNPFYFIVFSLQYKIDKAVSFEFLICIIHQIIKNLYLEIDFQNLYLDLRNSIQVQNNEPIHTYVHQRI